MEKRVLSFGAHPDDIELGCAGTEYKLIQQGYEIYHVYVTSGESGSQTLSKHSLAALREKEALDAAELLGAKDVIFLRAADGFTHFTEALRTEVINLIRYTRPEIIFVHGACDLFPDHRLVHQLVMSAVAAAAGPWFQETEGEPWLVKQIFGYEVWHPMSQYQLAVDITEFMEAKEKVLSCYKTQIEPTRYDEAFKGLARYRGVMSWAGSYAEVFEIIKAKLF